MRVSLQALGGAGNFHPFEQFQGALARLEKELHHGNGGDPYAHARSIRDDVIPKMNALRTLGDKLETIVADDLWPLPTYREMLFIK